MIVIDASAALDGLLAASDHEQTAAILAGGRGPVAAPDLMDVEIVGVLRRFERRGEISPVRARQVLADLRELPIVRYPARVTLDIAWRLRHNLTVYDAQYVALAQVLAAELLTADDAMALAARRARVAVTELP